MRRVRPTGRALPPPVRARPSDHLFRGRAPAQVGTALDRHDVVGVDLDRGALSDEAYGNDQARSACLPD